MNPKAIMQLLVFFCALLALMLGGCGDDDGSPGESDDDDTLDDDDSSLDDDDDDDDDNDDTDLPQWLRDRPYLLNTSLWGQDVDHSQLPKIRQSGCMGVGNGRVFGILGNQFPLGTWHNIGGPNYQKELQWFSDKEPWLYAEGARVTLRYQTLRRVRNTPIVIASARTAGLEWTSVNFAPKYDKAEDVEFALISVWIVRNLGTDTVNQVQLEIDSNFGRFQNGRLVENNLEGRTLTSRPLGVSAQPGYNDNDYRIPLGSLLPGQEKVVVVPYATTLGKQSATEIFEAIQNAGVDALLESTLDWWNDWASQITTIQTPDDKFNDLMRGLAVAIKINQAVNGAVSEMSQYSHTWLRDTHGPSLYYPLVGLVDDFREMIDYLWGAAVIRGGLANAYELDLDTGNLPPEPDWESMGVMSGRTRAEGPSALVLQHENYYKQTGDLDLLLERYGMLKHALVHQKFVDGCLLHFSSDETFEDVMEAAFGENFLEEPDESTLSSYSSYLMIRAAWFMAEVADMLNKPADVALFSTLTQDVTQCVEDTYWLETEGYYAVKVDTATRTPHRRPYEDINTIPLWLDVPLDRDRVERNFETIRDLLGRPDATIASSIPFPLSFLLPYTKQGVQTGMSHGYWLTNLDKTFHPDADEAFRRWEDVFTTAGFIDEAVVVEDYSHLAILREPWGFVCDVSNRFRSWEAGVMAHALLYHLTGYDANVPEGWVKLAPHLPPEWDAMTFAGLAFGDGRFDLTIDDNEGQGRRIVIESDAAFGLELTVPLDGSVDRIELDGAVLPGTEYSVEVNDYGRTVVEVEPVAVAAGQPRTFEMFVTKR